LISEIFFAAVRKEKLSTPIVVQFLHENCWYGKDIQKKSLTGAPVTYNWLNQLVPAIDDYFKQASWGLLDPAYDPNFVLCIDSLTLKIEGILRDFARICGVSTTDHKRDRNQRPISREKDIDQLLAEQSIKEKLSEDDILFFRFLLTEKIGFNLRHKVAHGLMEFFDYSVHLAHLLLLALLKLGKYDFTKN